MLEVNHERKWSLSTHTHTDEHIHALFLKGICLDLQPRPKYQLVKDTCVCVCACVCVRVPHTQVCMFIHTSVHVHTH